MAACAKCFHNHCDPGKLGCAWCQCGHPRSCNCVGCQNAQAVVVDTKTVVNGLCRILKVFVGPSAHDEASAYIETLPEFLTGRYGLDVGDSES